MSIIYEDMGSSVNLSQLKKISELEIENRMLNEVNANLARKYNEVQKEKFQDRQDFQKLEAKVKDLEAKLETAKPGEPDYDQYRFKVLSTGDDCLLKGYVNEFTRIYTLLAYDPYDKVEIFIRLNRETMQAIVTTLQKVLEDGE